MNEVAAWVLRGADPDHALLALAVGQAGLDLYPLPHLVLTVSVLALPLAVAPDATLDLLSRLWRRRAARR